MNHELPDPVAYPRPIGLQDLPSLDPVQIRQIHEDLARWSRLVFELQGQTFQVVRTTDPVECVWWLVVHMGGQASCVGLTSAVAQSLLESDQLSLSDLKGPALQLWVQRCLARRWPAFCPIAMVVTDMGDLPAALLPAASPSSWRAVLFSSGEYLPWAVSIWAAHAGADELLLEALRPFLKATLPSPLRDLPVGLPVVAARWTVDADVLGDLGVGDVLILN